MNKDLEKLIEMESLELMTAITKGKHALKTILTDDRILMDTDKLLDVYGIMSQASYKMLKIQKYWMEYKGSEELSKINEK